MEADPEDRIYDLQQALAVLPPAEWESFLTRQCANNPTLANDVLARQRSAEEPSAGDTRPWCLIIGKTPR